MNKIVKYLFSLILVFCSAFVIAGCNKPTELDYSDDAKSYVKTLYNSKGLETPSDYTVVGKVDVKGTVYEVVWEITVTAGNQEDVKLIKSEDGTIYTIDVNEDALVETTYTLTATIKGTDKTVSFNHKVPMFKFSTFEEWLELCKTNSKSTIIIKGYVVAIVAEGSSSAGSMYIQDADGHGYYAYNPTTTGEVEFGSEVIVKGTGTVFNGQYEFNKGCTVEATGNKVDALPFADGTADWTAATSQKDTSLIKYQNALVKLEGCKMANIDGSYYYFTIGDSEVKFNVYDTYYFLTESERAEITGKWEVGTVCDIYGLVSVYSNSYQIYPIGPDALKNLSLPTLSDADAIATVKESLTISQDKFEDETEFKVDIKGYGDQVSISWTADSEQVTFDVETGKIKVTLGEADLTVKLTATLTAGEASDTKEFTLTVLSASSDQYVPNFVESPVKETAYKFALNHTKLGEILWFSGVMNGFYLDTTTKADKGTDVYLAEVEGGYNLYFKDGDAKKYINIVVSGTYTNVKIEDAASSVWTFDSTNKILVTTANEIQYTIGTANTKTYNTLSPIKVEALSSNFVAQLTIQQAKVVEGEIEEGEEGEEVNNLKLTAVDFPTAYADAAIIAKTQYTAEYIANYGTGIQIRSNKKTTPGDRETGKVWNTTAFEKNIAKIVLIPYTAKQNLENLLANAKVEVATTVDFSDSVVLTGVANNEGTCVSYTVASGEYKYVRISNNSQYAVYCDTIEIMLVTE